MTVEVFYTRCRICQHEIEVEWGPETHSTADRLLGEHVSSHSCEELRAFALKQHVPERFEASEVRLI